MILATVLWGVAFSVQRSGNDHMEPMSFIVMRSITGVAALCVIIMVFDLFRYKRVTLWGSAKTPQENGIFFSAGSGADWFSRLLVPVSSTV